MSSFLNRLKNNIKTGLNNSMNEGDTGSICSFDEEGFLCPICHRKFPDTSGLEQHYLQAHSQPQAGAMYENTNGTRNSTKHEQIEDPAQEVSIWKQQFFTSEESRMQLSSELMQQRQRVGDLEEEVDLLQKQLRSTQRKVIEKSQEVGNLKANKDIYDAQLAIFTNELLSTQGELKEKQHQVDTLCNDLIPRPTNDDVDVLKRELITVQQRMNEMSLEKEQQIEQLRNVLSEIYEYTKRLDQMENTFDQNLLIYNDIINTHKSNDIIQIKQCVHLTRQRKEKIVEGLNHMRSCLSENKTEIEKLKQTNDQLQTDLEQRNQLNEHLTNDLQSEQKQINTYRIQIETLTNENHELEKSFHELKQEKNQLLLNTMDGDQDDERQNLVRQLTQEKDQFETQIKDLRKQLKQINEEKEHTQQEFDNISKQFTQITNEKNQLQDEQIQFNNEINSFKQQLDDLNKDKEQQITALNLELSSTREEYLSIKTKLETDLHQTNENHNNQKQEIERLENELKEQINQLEKAKQTINQQDELLTETKFQYDTIQKEKDDHEKQIENNQQTIEQLQITISQLNTDLNQKDNSIHRLSDGIRRSIDSAHKTHQFIQQNILTSQINLLALIEQSEQESETIRTQTLEEIRNEFTNYLTVIHAVIIDNKIKLEKQIEDDHFKLNEEKQHAENELNKIKTEYDQLIKEYDEQKQKLGEVTQNLLQVSESLSDTTQTANLQQEKSEKQISSLESELTNTRSDLESRIKKYEMQLSALTENLATVRGELKTAHEKLIDYEEIKSDNTDLEARLNVNQDERQVLLERSLTSESRSEKLLLENGQLAKKNSDLESALQEIAREYQSLQIYTNKISQRRWLNDSDVHECMKCNQTFSLTQRKHHCRCCGNIYCDPCSSKKSIVAATSNKPQRVCDQCFKELTS